jgi:hypothetical protein
LYNIFQGDGRKNYLLTIGAAGIVLTHNISTLFTVIVAVIYVLINIKKLKEWNILRKLLINAVFICLIVSFFYLPMLESKLGADYAVFQEGKMGTAESVKENSLYLSQLLFGRVQTGGSYPLSSSENLDNDMCFTFGLCIIIPLLMTPFIYNKIDKKKRKLYVATLLVGIACLIGSTNIMPWDKMPNFVGIIQHPFRLLLIATFTLTPIAAINISKLFKNIDYKHICIYMVIALIEVSPMIQLSSSDTQFDENSLRGTDTIEALKDNSPSCAYYEYLPVKAEQNKEYLSTRGQEAIILEGDGQIDNQSKINGIMEFNYQSGEEETKIELPYIYYKGYNIQIDGNTIDYQESDYGMIEITIPQNMSGTVTIKYEGTLLTKISFAISVISSLLFIVYAIIEIKKSVNFSKKELPHKKRNIKGICRKKYGKRTIKVEA